MNFYDSVTHGRIDWLSQKEDRIDAAIFMNFRIHPRPRLYIYIYISPKMAIIHTSIFGITVPLRLFFHRMLRIRCKQKTINLEFQRQGLFNSEDKTSPD